MAEDKTVETDGSAEITEGAAEAPPAAPLLQIITPHTTPEEVAAIVAVFAALGGDAPAPEQPRREWSSPARQARFVPGRGLPHGPGAWRASALPR